MTDAPEQIWAVFDEDVSAQTRAVYAQDNPDGFVGSPTKYTRTDLSDARIAALEAERDKLNSIMDVLEHDFAESVRTYRHSAANEDKYPNRCHMVGRAVSYRQCLEALQKVRANPPQDSQ